VDNSYEFIQSHLYVFYISALLTVLGEELHALKKENGRLCTNYILRTKSYLAK